MKGRIMPHRWMERETTARPKARFLSFLAVIWAPAALLAALWLWLDSSGAKPPEIRHLAWLVLIPEALLVSLAILFRLVERPRRVPPPVNWEGPEVR